MNLNKVLIIGRMTADPELRKTGSGQSVTSFGVATNRVWTDKAGAKQEETEFHNVVCWARQAEIATQFLKKGSLVMIEGRLQTRSWQDQQGGNRKTTEIICERLQLGPRAQSGQMGGAPSGEQFNQVSSPAQNVPAASSNKGNGSPNPREEEIPVIDLDAEPAADKDEVPF